MNDDSQEKIIETYIENIQLTNKKLRKETKSFGKKQIQSIMLEDITSSQVIYRSKPMLIIWSIIILLISIISGAIILEEFRGGFLGALTIAIGISISLILIIRYFITRNYSLSFGSSSLTINFKAKRVKYEKLIKTINVVEKVKIENRLLTTPKKQS